MAGHGRIPVGGAADSGLAAGGVRGEGTGGGQRTGSRRGGSGYRGPALPPAAWRRALAVSGRPPLFAFLWQAEGLGFKGIPFICNVVLFFLTNQRRWATLEHGGWNPPGPPWERVTTGGSRARGALRASALGMRPGFLRPSWGKGRGGPEDDFPPGGKTDLGLNSRRSGSPGCILQKGVLQ
jgi:hypothetical protein